MALLGIESVVYGVDDLDACARFYDDFGLQRSRSDADGVDYRLPEGSSFLLRRSGDPALPPPFLPGQGPREVIWGVDAPASLQAIAAELARDREVRCDEDGTLHARDDAGINIGFRLFARQPLEVDPAPPENNLSAVQRWNRHRKWYERAQASRSSTP